MLSLVFIGLYSSLNRQPDTIRYFAFIPKVDKCPQLFFRIRLDHRIKRSEPLEHCVRSREFPGEFLDSVRVPTVPIGRLTVVAVEPWISGRVIHQTQQFSQRRS